jgi:hypothetical protein
MSAADLVVKVALTVIGAAIFLYVVFFVLHL